MGSLLRTVKVILILFLIVHPQSIGGAAVTQNSAEGNGYVKTLRNVLLITQAKREIK